MIQVQQVNVRCAEKTIVRNGTFSLKAGEKVVLTGKSGIGKTQLVEALFAPEIDGERIMFVSQKDIVWLPQHAEQSFNPLRRIGTHFEDIRVKRALPRKAFYAEVVGYLERLNLGQEVLKYTSFECSGGMLQRLQIVLACCQKPKLLIADEPTAALDYLHIQKVFDLWEEGVRDGMALLIITHQLNHYTSFGTRFLQLDNEMLQPIECQQSGHFKKQNRSREYAICCAVNGSVQRARRSFWRTQWATVLTVQNFEINQGEIIGIRGESGSGKSTFLTALQGQLPIAGDTLLPRMQYVPQLYHASMPDHWLVEEIVQEAQRAAKCTEARCDALLQQLQLERQLLKQPVSTLSGGQQQRLALFRVLLQSPQLLLLDESFASLDDETTLTITEVLLKLAQEGLAIICVSHDEHWLNAYTQRQYSIKQNILRKYSNEKNLDDDTTRINTVSSL